LVTSIQFEHSFNNLNNESAHPGLQSIDTDPIKGYKLYSLIRVVQTTIGRIVLDELEFVDSSNNILEKYKLTKNNELIYISETEIPLVDFFIKVRGKNDKNGIIERLYSHKIIPRTLELSVTIDSHSSAYMKPGEEAKIGFTLNNHNPNDLTIDISIVQSLPLFTITLDTSQFILQANKTLTSYFNLKASNNLTLIDYTSEISILAKSPFQLDAFNGYVLRATIISPFSDVEPPHCTHLFPSGKNLNEMCQGIISSCSSRHWDVLLNVTDSYNKSIVYPPNVRLGLHSVVLTYYDNEDVLQSNKDTIKFVVNETNKFNLQMLMSSNDCCRKYADIVAYDQNGNKATCMEFQRVSFSNAYHETRISWKLLVVLSSIISKLF
ncbi:unnamed protein product, partial [Rotaria sp. Silwood1]